MKERICDCCYDEDGEERMHNETCERLTMAIAIIESLMYDSPKPLGTAWREARAFLSSLKSDVPQNET